MTPEVWIILALAAYWGMFLAVFLAFKPKPVAEDAYPDWFWGGDPDQPGWVESKEDKP